MRTVTTNYKGIKITRNSTKEVIKAIESIDKKVGGKKYDGRESNK